MVLKCNLQSFTTMPLAPLTYNNKVVITTELLAKELSLAQNTITKNLNRHPADFIQGEDYICLSGKELAAFIETNFADTPSSPAKIQVSSKTRHLYLWTESGCWLHVKITQNKEAFTKFRQLLNTYFSLRQLAEELPTQLTVHNSLSVSAQLAQLMESQAQILKKLEAISHSAPSLPPVAFPRKPTLHDLFPNGNPTELTEEQRALLNYHYKDKPNNKGVRYQLYNSEKTFIYEFLTRESLAYFLSVRSSSIGLCLRNTKGRYKNLRIKRK